MSESTNHLHIDVVIVPIILEKADRVRGLTAGLRVHEVITEGRNCVDGTQDVRRRYEAVPVGCVTRVNKLQPWDAMARKPVLIGRVLLEPADPEDLDLFPPAGDFLRASVVDRNCEDIDKDGCDRLQERRP